MKTILLRLCPLFSLLAPLIYQATAASPETPQYTKTIGPAEYFGSDASSDYSEMEESRKEELLNIYRALAKREKLPEKLIDCVTLDTIWEMERRHGGPSKPPQYIMYFKNGLCIEMFTSDPDEKIPYDTPYLLGFERFDFIPGDLIQEFPKKFSTINPATKKPYFTFPKKLLKKMEQAERMKLIYDILVDNFAKLATVFTINKKIYQAGGIVGKFAAQPYFNFKEKPVSLPLDYDDEQDEIRDYLGYYMGDFHEMWKNGSVNVSVSPRAPQARHSFFKSTFTTSYTVLDPNGDRNLIIPIGSSGLNYEPTLTTFICHQLTYKEECLQAMQSGMHKLLEKEGISKNTPEDDLSADQQALLAWSNTLDRYVALLVAQNVTSISDPEAIKISSIGPFIGKEITTALTENELKQIDKIKQGTDKKHNAWRDKLHDEFQDLCKKYKVVPMNLKKTK